jgi:hypothetical protein
LRKPKRTVFQQSLRDVEKSVSGALFLLLNPQTVDEKTSIRAYFAAGVCYELERHGAVSRAALTAQLSPIQLNAFEQLELATPDEISTTPFLRVAMVFGFLVKGSHTSDTAVFDATIAAWFQLSYNYVAGRLRGDLPSPVVDWGRRELEFRERLKSLASAPSFRVNLKQASFQILDGQTVKGQATLEVLGLFSADEESYQAGWAAPTIPMEARPYPVLGCASQLYRVSPVEAQSEAHRCGALAGVQYVFEYPVGSELQFLGLGRIESVADSSSFGEEDVRPEVMAKIRDLESSLSSKSPERVADLFLAHAQALTRRLSLFESGSQGYLKLEETTLVLKALGKGIRTQSYLGGTRSELGKGERRDLSKELTRLQTIWSG